MAQTSQSPEVLIVGAGLAGLACARELKRAHVRVQLIEAADDVGGRVRTDVVDSFRLDRGFQVLLTAYPEAQRALRLDELELRPFYNGAEVFWGGNFHRLADPFRHPWAGLMSLSSPIGSLHDKYYLMLLRQDLKSLEAIPRHTDEVPTEELFRAFGFSSEMIQRFLRPFFGGIFLERDLRTSSRVFQFVYAMMTQGNIALPRLGMQAIPSQLASRLPAGSIRLNTSVTAVRPGSITLASGEQLAAPHIVLAVDEVNATRLLHEDRRAPEQRAVTCLYFSTSDQNLPRTPIVYLDGDGRGPVNHAAILSQVSPDYAPEGQHLISATVLGAPSSGALEGTVREHLSKWFGPGVRQWRHLRSYTIPHAQAENRQTRTGSACQSAFLAPGLFRCGDYLEDVSINGALLSGRRAAEAILEARAAVSQAPIPVSRIT